MSKIRYIIVSTEHQETARQQEIMCDYQVDRIFSEKLSGANGDRPQLRAMLEYVREGDTPQTNGNAPQSRPSLRSGKLYRLKRKDLRSACVSKSQAFVSYSVPKGYAVIVACTIMMIWTCAERFAGVPIDYGQVAHINIVP